MSSDHGSSDHGHHDHGDANPLADGLMVLVPVLGIMGAFAFTVFLIVSSTVHH